MCVSPDLLTCLIAVAAESKPTMCIIGGGPFVSRVDHLSRRWMVRGGGGGGGVGANGGTISSMTIQLRVQESVKHIFLYSSYFLLPKVRSACA